MFNTLNLRKICLYYKTFSIIGLMMLTLSACDFCMLGCRSGSPPEDWYTLGYCDGQQGIQKYAGCESTPCGEYCFEPPNFAYYEGWRKGVRQFCQPCNGFALGCQGIAYPCICPPDLAGPFRAAWYQGIKEYYTPNYCCGDGLCKTYYCDPPLPCKMVGEPFMTPAGCPCNVCP